MNFFNNIVNFAAESELATAVAETAQNNERLFGLDAQLIFDSLVTALNVFILVILLSYILFNPLRAMLKKREDRITSDRETAKSDMEQAAALKAEYEDKLKNINKEADEILSEARKKALVRENSIIDKAHEEAKRIVEHANQEAQLEKKKVVDEVKQEMVTIATAMASKIVAQSMNAKVSDELIEQTLNEMGDKTWRS